MKPFSCLCTLLIVAGWTSVGSAQVKVAWKLNKGDTFYVKQVRQAEQKLELKGSLIDQKLKSSNLSQFQVLHADPDGKLVLQQKIESVSATTEQTNPGVKDFLSQLAGATFVFHLDADYQITKVEGYEQLVQKLAKGDADLEKSARMVLPEAELRDGVNQLFDFLPKKPAGKGDAWDSVTMETFGPLGSLKITSKWSLADKAAEPDLVRITGTQKALFDATQASKTLPFQIKAGAVTEVDAKLEVLFDLAKGRLQQRTLKRHLKLQLLIYKDKHSLDMKIAQDVSVTLEVLDKKPKEK